MARRPSGILRVKVEGLGDALQVPIELERSRVEFPRRLAVELARDLAHRLPRGPSPPHLASTVIGRVLPGGTVSIGTQGSEYAKALEEGATRPGAEGLSRGVVLRFEVNGRVVFARRSILQRNRPGGKPFTRAFRHRQRVVDRVWEEVMT